MATPDPTSPIRLFAITHAFDEQVSIFGQSMEEVRAALGEAGSVTDFTELLEGVDVGLSSFGVIWYFEALGVEVSFVEGRVKGLTFHSGTYQGGLIPRSWARWDGGLAPDMTWESVSEEDLLERFGPPKNAYDCDAELSEIMDEEPMRRVVYPGWTFEFLLDGRLQSVLLEAPKPPPVDPLDAELDELLADLERDA